MNIYYKELNKKDTFLNEIHFHSPETTWRSTGAKFTLMQTRGNKIPTDPQSMTNNDFRLEDVQSK